MLVRADLTCSNLRSRRALRCCSSDKRRVASSALLLPTDAIADPASPDHDRVATRSAGGTSVRSSSVLLNRTSPFASAPPAASTGLGVGAGTPESCTVATGSGLTAAGGTAWRETASFRAACGLCSGMASEAASCWRSWGPVQRPSAVASCCKTFVRRRTAARLKPAPYLGLRCCCLFCLLPLQ